MMPSLSFVVPFFNEKDYLPLTVKQLSTILKRCHADFELILIDDGSDDGSGGIADLLSHEHSEIRVIHHKKNLGLGHALRTGFRMATKDFVFYTDMDMPFDFEKIPQIISHLGNRDVLIAHRIRNQKSESYKTILYSKVYNGILSLFLGIEFKDVNFALKIIRRSVLQDLKLKLGNSLIDLELVLSLLSSRFPIYSFPVVYTPRKLGSSHLSNWKNIFSLLLFFFYNFFYLKKMVREAGPIGIDYGDNAQSF